MIIASVVRPLTVTMGHIYVAILVPTTAKAMTKLRHYLLLVFNNILFCASAQQCNKTGAELSAGQENPFTFPCEAQQLVLTQDGLNDTSFDVSDCKSDGKLDLTLSKSRTGQIKLTFICHKMIGNDCSFFTINNQTLLNDTILQDSVDCGSGQLYSINQPSPTTDVSSLQNDPSTTSPSNTLTDHPIESNLPVTSIDSSSSTENAMASSSDNNSPSAMQSSLGTSEAPESGSVDPGSSVDGGSPTITSSGTGNPMPPATCVCSSV